MFRDSDHLPPAPTCAPVLAPTATIAFCASSFIHCRRIVNAECFPATPIDRACSNCVVVMKEMQPTGVVGMSIDEMQLHRPRQWGACFLACHLYGQLELDLFFAARLPNSREGTRWQHILQTLVCYRLIDPGSEWRLHRQWFEQSAMGDLIGADYSLVEKNALYRCLDKLLEHKDALFRQDGRVAECDHPPLSAACRSQGLSTDSLLRLPHSRLVPMQPSMRFTPRSLESWRRASVATGRFLIGQSPRVSDSMRD